jgi:hypothetical protein
MEITMERKLPINDGDYRRNGNYQTNECYHKLI